MSTRLRQQVRTSQWRALSSSGYRCGRGCRLRLCRALFWRLWLGQFSGMQMAQHFSRWPYPPAQADLRLCIFAANNLPKLGCVAARSLLTLYHAIICGVNASGEVGTLSTRAHAHAHLLHHSQGIQCCD